MSAGIIASSGTYITLTGVTLCMAEWDVEFDGGLVDATTFCDGGYSDRIATIKDAKISIKGFWNTTTRPHGVPPGIVAGASLLNLTLGISAALGITYAFPVIIVDKVRTLSMVRDALKFDFDAYNRGSWTYAL